MKAMLNVSIDDYRNAIRNYEVVYKRLKQKEHVSTSLLMNIKRRWWHLNSRYVQVTHNKPGKMEENIVKEVFGELNEYEKFIYNLTQFFDIPSQDQIVDQKEDISVDKDMFELIKLFKEYTPCQMDLVDKIHYYLVLN